MGGLFGEVSKGDCVLDLFYGTDYHSHLGTKLGGLCVKGTDGYSRSIHNIENDYFRSKFEADLPKHKGNVGIGVISDTDSQPLIIGSHLGTFSIVTVGKINNLEELGERALKKKVHFSEMSGGELHPTELVALRRPSKDLAHCYC
jgi:amidophosphoribosyltransferase